MQTTTAARSGLITRDNIEDIALKGRDFAGMLKLLPGVIDTSNREAPGWGSMGGLSINGRGGGFNFSYDGVTNKDTGSNSGNYAAPALDSIAEVRVQTSNFQAEYGRSSGATITVITRSGSKDFRGSAAYYKRDDALNGNEFPRRQQCGARRDGRSASRRSTRSTTRPGRSAVRCSSPAPSFNKGRNKLFFFFSQDMLAAHRSGQPEPAPDADRARARRRLLADVRRHGQPDLHPRSAASPATAARPRGGPACFPGNIIPANRIDAVGAGAAEPVPAAERDRPDRRQPVQLRVPDRAGLAAQRPGRCAMDWNIAPKTTAYGRVQWGYEKRAGRRVVPRLGRRLAAAAEQVRDRHRQLRQHAAAHLQPDDVLRVHGRRELGAPVHERRSTRRRKTSTTARCVLPGLPAVLPAGESRSTCCRTRRSPAASSRWRQLDRVVQLGATGWPFFGFNTLFNFSGNLTKVKGAHNMKTGIFVEHTTRPAQRASSFNGIAQLQHRRLEPAEHEHRVRQRAARRGHAVPGVERPPVGARPVHEHRVLRAGQLAREAELHHRRRRALLLHHPDAERGRQGRGVRARCLCNARAGAAAVSSRRYVDRARTAQ